VALTALAMPSAQASEAPRAANSAIPIVIPPWRFTSYTVTATLTNHTACTLVGSRGWPTAGALNPAPPRQIAPGATGTWKVSGSWLWEYPGASVTLTYALTGCSLSGEVGYTTRNDDGGLAYGDGSCDSGRPRGTRSVLSGVPGKDATVSIDLQSVLFPVPVPLPLPKVHPTLGNCGDFPG
jgi:hypothetical protein